MPAIGKKIYKGKKFSITPASPDHRIYHRGFVIGGKGLRELLKDAPGNSPKPEDDKN